jgi:glycine cleavage system regulatory protein
VNWDHAQCIKLPDPADVKASLEATPATGKLSIGLRLTLYGAAMADVRKNGKPVQVKMVVADASGAEIASKVGTLADFGFS